MKQYGFSNLKDWSSNLSLIYKSLIRPNLQVLKSSLLRTIELKTYLANRREFKKKFRDDQFAFGEDFPCLDDRRDNAGTAEGHYFHQDLWVAQKIFAEQRRRHIDVGSRVDGFVALLASFRKVEVVDI